MPAPLPLRPADAARAAAGGRAAALNALRGLAAHVCDDEGQRLLALAEDALNAIPETIAPTELPGDIGLAAQQTAERHLAACQEAYWQLEEGADVDVVDCPAVGPFDGCDTCIVREVLHAAWPILAEAAGLTDTASA